MEDKDHLSETQVLEKEREEQRKAQALIQKVPEPHLATPSEPSTLKSGEVEALYRLFDLNMKLQLARIDQLAGAWNDSWNRVTATLQTMEDTARILQVIIGESENTRELQEAAINRLGLATTALLKISQQQQEVLLLLQQQAQGQ